jgi:hypothetical protein
MKRVLTATCFAMACAVGLAAQQTTGTTGSEGQSGQSRSRTVTGCLRAGDTAGTYTLTDIQMGARSGDTTAGGGSATTGGGTTGTTGGTMAEGQRGQMPTSVTLNPESGVDLKAHVGHKVEVTGTMAPGGRSGGDPTTGTTGGGTGQETTGGQAHATRTLNVTSVRMVSESCS